MNEALRSFIQGQGEFQRRQAELITTLAEALNRLADSYSLSNLDLPQSCPLPTLHIPPTQETPSTPSSSVLPFRNIIGTMTEYLVLKETKEDEVVMSSETSESDIEEIFVEGLTDYVSVGHEDVFDEGYAHPPTHIQGDKKEVVEEVNPEEAGEDT